MEFITVGYLVHEYVSYLRTKRGRGRCPGHVREAERRVRRMVEGAATLEEVTPDRIEQRMRDLAGEIVMCQGKLRPRARQTIDHHRRELGTFFRWLILRRITTENPVASVEPWEWEDPRAKARPFTPVEARQFFDRVSGRRVIVYHFWASTGLRPEETGRLDSSQAVLDPPSGIAPYVLLLGSQAKNRHEVQQPLNPDAVGLLRPLPRVPGTPLFARVPTEKTFLSDLRKAGLWDARLSLEGNLCRTSLRKTFATEAGRQGVTVAMAQKLMRHSTPDLTMNVYTHYDLAERARAVEGISFLPAHRKPA